MRSRIKEAASGVIDGLSLIPPIVALAVSIHFTVDLPRSAYREIVAPVPIAIDAGDSTIQKIREPVMGVRMKSDRMVHSFLGVIFGWDRHFDTAAIVALGLFSFFSVRRIIRRTWPEFPLRMACMNLLASLLIFWLVMGTYWTFSPLPWHAMVIPCVVGVVMAMGARSSPPMARVAFAMVLAAIATGAFPSGGIAWVILFGMIALLAWADRRGEWRWGAAAALAVAGLAINLAVYRTDFARTNSDIFQAAESLPLADFLFFFTGWLGSPFSSPPPWYLLEQQQGDWQMKVGLVIGTFMLGVTVVVLIAALIRCWKEPDEAYRLAPWMALASFGLAEGMALSYGRANLLPTCYTVGCNVGFSIWVYLSVLGILFCFPKVSGARRALHLSSLVMLPFFVVSYAWGIQSGLDRIELDATTTREFRAGLQLMPLYKGAGHGNEKDIIGQPFDLPPDELYEDAKAADKAGFL